MLQEALQTQEPMYSAALQRGVQLLRLRLVELPLSDYLRYYEFPSYRISENLGERIYIKEIESTDSNLPPDCIFFDDGVMYVNAYDGCGGLVGAVEVTDKGEIASCRDRADRLLAEAKTLDTYMLANSL